MKPVSGRATSYLPTFGDAHARLRRAEKQFEEFKAELLPTRANLRNRIELLSDFDPQSREHVFRIFSLPDEAWLEDIAVILGDVMANTRSALDYVMWQLALVNSAGSDPKGASGIYFPCVVTDRAAFAKHASVRKLRTSDQAMISRFQPFNSWNASPFHPLLDVFMFSQQKHRTLFPIRTSISNFGIEPIAHGECTGFRPSPGGLVLELGSEFCRATVRPLDDLFDPHEQLRGWSIPHIGIGEQGRDAVVVMHEALCLSREVVEDALRAFAGRNACEEP